MSKFISYDNWILIKKNLVKTDKGVTANLTMKYGYPGFDDLTTGILRAPPRAIVANQPGGGTHLGTMEFPFGRVYCNDTFRSAGVSGWYNETYGGGFYMNDPTTIRVYGDKQIATAGQVWCGNVIDWNGGGARYALWAADGVRCMQWGSAGTYFHITTDIGAFGINCWASDKSLKENIKDTKVNHALDKISKINHVQFDWKRDNTHTELGYIADDLEKVMSCLTYDVEQYGEDEKPNGEYLKHIDPLPLLSLITMGMQELIEENKYLWKYNNASCQSILKNCEDIDLLKKENIKLRKRLDKGGV